jgi:purine-binding chemotaxis protein CheW
MRIDSRPVSGTPSDTQTSVLLVRLAERQYALPLAAVQRILPMAYVQALPDSGSGLLGMLNLHGDLVPVLDPHPRLGLPTPKVAAEHRLVLVQATNPFLLWVDEVEEVITVTEDELSVVPAQQASPLVPRVLRFGTAVVPVLAPAALEPRGSLR